MYRSTLYLAVALAIILTSSLISASGVCTGYPKMYNGKPCASTTRYWDGQKGACGCGTSDTSPFSWQWTKPTAAASAPIFGSGTWCGSGCGKCFKLTPTAIGASAEGTGAPALTPLVVKVSNLCPYAGNEAWCAYDTNSFGYDAHFDLMDYNMNGLISSMGWNNPEVTYEEVDCAANGYTDWNCQCASATSSSGATAAPTAASTPAPTANAATSAPTAKAATSAPTAKAATAAPTAKPPAKAATSAPVAPTTAPAPAATSAPVAPVAGGIKIQVNSGSNQYWFGFSVVSSISNIVSVDVMTSGSTSWTRMNFEGNQYWNMYSFAPSSPISAPISLRFNGANGSVIANNIVTSFQQSSTVDTGVSV
jgi:hypothetical protein